MIKTDILVHVTTMTLCTVKLTRVNEKVEIL